MGTDFGSNRAAWLVAGFLGRKILKDMLGRWSFIPVLAVSFCVWSKWRAKKDNCRAHREKMEEMQRSARLRLRALKQPRALAGETLYGHTGHRNTTIRGSSMFDTWSSDTSSCPNPRTKRSIEVPHTSAGGRRPGDRIGDIPSSSTAISAMNHLSSKAGRETDTDRMSVSVAAAKNTSFASSEWLEWLGFRRGVIPGAHVCAADRGSRPRRGNADCGEWRGAFMNRMRGIPRRNAFKTARGKVYLRSGNRRPGSKRQPNASIAGRLESVREEEE